MPTACEEEHFEWHEEVARPDSAPVASRHGSILRQDATTPGEAAESWWALVCGFRVGRSVIVVAAEQEREPVEVAAQCRRSADAAIGTHLVRQTGGREIDVLRFLCQRGWIPHRWGERQENDDGEGIRLCRRCGGQRSGQPVAPPFDPPHLRSY
jgi:hypothetical protein